MDIFFEENKQNFKFILKNVEKKFIPVLEKQFYIRKNHDFYKTFPKPINNINKIKDNYQKYNLDMVLQAGKFKQIKWRKALISFIEKIKDCDIEWWLTGSCALKIRGVDIKPNDVDIMLNSKDIDKINELFLDNIIWPIADTNGWIVKYFGVIFLNGQIDLAFDPQDFADDPEPVDFGPYAKKNLEIIRWNNYDIKVPPLELQLKSNKLRRRKKRVEKIQEFLEN